MSLANGFCWHCSKPLTHLDFGRQDRCPHCGRDTRACKACVHYERGINNDCRETSADRVVDKERSNFCDYFKPSQTPTGNVATAKDVMKAAAEALFKKK